MKKNANVHFIHVIVLILAHGMLGIKHIIQRLAKNRTKYFEISNFFLI